MARLEPLQYYKWLWQAWRSNRRVQRMHYIARGLYRELLDEQWSEGSIPPDLFELADICGCPKSVMQEHWPEIEPCFVQREDGRLVNPKMETVRTDKDATRIKQSEAGKASAAAKALNRQAKSTDVQQTLSGLEQPLYRREEKSREEQRREEERENERATEPPTPPPPVTPPPPPPTPANALNPMANADVSELVTRIVVSHPRSAMRKTRWNEVTISQTSAVLKAMRDEMDAIGASPMECLEMIANRVEGHARDVPIEQHQFFKDVEEYFRLHEYRLESEYFNRKVKENGTSNRSQQRTDGNIEAARLARQIRANRLSPA